MMNNDSKDGSEVSIFKRPLWVSVFALTAAVAWGWAYPLIKLGFAEFGISGDMTGAKMLFAGVRFSIAGLIVLLVAWGKGCRFAVAGVAGAAYLLLFALLNTTLHYAFFYIGLSNSGGARAAILNSLGVFMLVLLACLFYKSDRLTVRKVVGCVLGFLGIMLLNVGAGDSGAFTLSGDGMIILNTVCAAFAGIMTRGLSSRVDVFVGTGYSLAVGGAMLAVVGIAMGGVLPVVSVKGCGILLLLVLISSLCFALYNKLLTCNEVGKVAIFNSLIPVVGAAASCVCLGEVFYGSYIVAALLAMVGIYVINKGK